MALEAAWHEFTEDFISETDKLLAHNRALRDNLTAIAAIKEAMQYEDYEEAFNMWVLLPESVRDDLWVAPSKGGIFTTEERRIMQTDKFSNKGNQK